MSCFVVPDYHIDVLVSWSIANHAPAFIDGLTPRTLAAELWVANATAYNARYGEVVGESYSFTMRPEAHSIDPVQILKACDCLEYQCSDWPNYEGSVAERILRRIRDRAIACLPGYRAAAWTLEEVAA